MSYPPQPASGAPAPYGHGYPYPYGHGYPYPSDHPKAVTILVLGILSVVLCHVAGPFAWVMGRRALQEIDASGGTIGGRGYVVAGYVCGRVATALFAMGVVILVVIFGLYIATHS